MPFSPEVEELYREAHRTYMRVGKSKTCPTCDAEVGELCKGVKSGKKIPARFHVARQTNHLKDIPECKVLYDEIDRKMATERAAYRNRVPAPEVREVASLAVPTAEGHAINNPEHVLAVRYGPIADAKDPQPRININCVTCGWWDQR